MASASEGRFSSAGTTKRIDESLASSEERLARLATRLIVEEALEAEVEDALGRG